MGAGMIFKIDLLSANEALDLFLRISGVERGLLAKNLSEQCGRLPISIAIIAKGLINKRKVFWEDMLNQLRNSDPDRKVQATIELSYDNLYRQEEKMFFLLCALFPEDSKIPVQVLFEYGLGWNLFERVDKVDEALVRSHKLALSLKSSSLLLDEGDENFVKMHDVVRDVALSIASKGKNVFLVRSVAQWREWTEKTAISLWLDDNQKLPDALECPQLQILRLHYSNRDRQLHDNFFVGMKNLTILDMSDMRFVGLPPSFKCLENLQTLRFSSCDLGDISTIGKLQNLVSLSFYDSNIQVLPKEVGELSKLRLLDLSRCERLKVIIPGVIQNLSQLEMLRVDLNFQWRDRKEVYRPENASLSELIHLSHLMILEICIRDTSMLPDDVLFENLTKFKVSIGRGRVKMNISFSNSQILKLTRLSENELLKAGIKMLMKKAQHLHLEYISGISVALPSHFGGYGSLKKLIVENCPNVNYILDMTESEYKPETPSLQLLDLYNLPVLKEISKGEFPSLFVSKLEHLNLCRLPHLVHLWQFDAKSVALANLTIMSVKSCDKLEYIFDHGSAKSLSKLKKLEVIQCRNLQAICLSKEEDDVVVFLQLSYLKLEELENITFFGKQVIFHALETLDIYKLQSLEKIWHIHTPVESFFQLKVLKLTQCPELLVVFPPHSTSGLRNLEKIHIKNCHKLETLFQSDEVPLTVDDEMVFFPQLSTLELINLPKFTTILSTTSQNISRATVNFPILKRMHVEGLNSVKKIWHDNVSTKCFSQLQKLHVSKCETMESIIEEASGEQNFDKAIEFSNLRTLELDNLPRLASFYNGECALKFPCVGYFCIKGCPKLKTFASMSRETPETSCENFVSDEALFGQQISFGKLSNLVLEQLESMEEIWHRGHPVTTVEELSRLSVKGCDRLLKIFPSNLLAGLQNLTLLEVGSCRSLEHVLAVEDHPPLLSRLWSLELHDLPALKQLWWNKNSCESFGLPNCRNLKIVNCPTLQFIFDPSVAGRLDNLSSLRVENCSSIVEIVAEKPGKKMEFPLLRTLTLVNLPCFKVKQDVEFPEAFFVVLDRCFNIEHVEKFRNWLAGPVKFFESFVE